MPARPARANYSAESEAGETGTSGWQVANEPQPGKRSGQGEPRSGHVASGAAKVSRAQR